MKKPNLPMPGIKNDSEKLLWQLLPWAEIEDMVRGLTYGAFKYEPDNWQKVTPDDRYIGAMMRHFVAHLQGEAIDDETQVPHLALVALNAIFALWKHKQAHQEEYETYKANCQAVITELKRKKECQNKNLNATYSPADVGYQE